MSTAAQLLPTVTKKVAEILKISPETRESDKVLHLAYLVLHHDLAKKLGSKFEVVRDIFLHPETPSMDTIGRARRKLQEQGQFPPCDPQRRQELSAEFVQALERLN